MVGAGVGAPTSKVGDMEVGITVGVRVKVGRTVPVVGVVGWPCIGGIDGWLTLRVGGAVGTQGTTVGKGDGAPGDKVGTAVGLKKPGGMPLTDKEIP